MVDTTKTIGSSEPPTPQGKAGAPKIEITPEMLDADEEVIWALGLWPEVAASSWASSLVSQVYLAMEAARCSKLHQ
jgi:hypothetical protein